MHGGNLTGWTAKADEAKFEPKPKGFTEAWSANHWIN
jgi:hypothetical protein